VIQKQLNKPLYGGLTAVNLVCVGLLLFIGCVTDASTSKEAGRSAGPRDIKEIYVSASQAEADTRDGSIAHPYTDLPNALAVARAADAPDGVHLILMDGHYDLPQPLRFGTADSGRPSAPLVIRALHQGKAFLSASLTIRRDALAAPDNDRLIGLIQDVAKPHVRVAKLKGTPAHRVMSGSTYSEQLCCGEHTLQRAKWPNKGFAHADKILDEGQHWIAGRSLTPKPTYSVENPVGGLFTTHEKWNGDWSAELAAGNHPSLRGYFSADWYFESDRIATIRDEQIQLTGFSRYGFKSTSKLPRRIFVEGLLSELDKPGEWFYDKATSELYVWPIDDTTDLQLLRSTMLCEVKDAEQITFQGLVFEQARNGISVEGGANVAIEGCTFRNLLGTAISVKRGYGHRISSCNIYRVSTPLDMRGTPAESYQWDRSQTPPRIVPDGFIVHNNHIHHCRANRGMTIQGVGIVVSHNLVHDLPGSAITWAGNDNIFEYNEFYSLLKTMGDWGVFYAGANWTSWGNVLRYNFTHHILCMPQVHPVNGFYFDQLDMGDSIYGNVFYEAGNRGILVNGGAGFSIYNNLFIEGYIDIYNTGVYAEKTREKRALFDKGELKRGDVEDFFWRTEQVTGVKGWDRSPWAEAYPAFKTIMNDDPFAPIGNRISMNGHTDTISEKVRLNQVPEGMITPVDDFDIPLATYKDPSVLDFSLRTTDGTPPGFEPIPFDAIGLVVTAQRQTVPAKRAYRRQVKLRQQGRPPYDPDAQYDWRTMNDVLYEDEAYWTPTPK